MSHKTSENLSEDLRALAEDAQDFLEGKGEDAIETAQNIRNRLAEALASAEQTVENLKQKTSDGVQAADKAVRARPYQALGITLAVGVLIGLFLGRKK